MKIIVTFLAFCSLLHLQAQQPNERFYKGESGKRIRQQGQNIGIETCSDNSQTTLTINNSSREEESESKKFIGSCSDSRDIQLSDKGVLKFRISQYGDTLIASKYRDNGRMSFQKTTIKQSISRFQQKLIPYQNGGYIATYITYPPAGKTHTVVGYIIYDVNGNEIAQRTIDSLVDASPTVLLLEGANPTEFYILQGSDAQCGKYKLHKLSRTTKFWTTPLNYDFGCHLMQLESFAINNQNTRLGLLFVGNSKVTFNTYFMVDNATGALIPTTFDMSTRVRYNAKTAFGRNNEVYFARVIDYNTANSPVPDRSALEVLQFDANQNQKSSKRYFDTPKRNTDTLPQLEDMLVATDGTLYLTGSRLKKTWLLADKDSTTGVQQNPTGLTIRQVTQVPNSPNILIEVESTDAKAVKLEIFNALNQIVRTQQTTVQQGVNPLQIDFGNQPQGTYIVKLTTGAGSVSDTFVKR
jgi:ribosomal protein L21E